MAWTLPPKEEQRRFVIDAVLADPLAVRVLEGARRLGLPDHALMAGAVYKAVWNAMTGRPPGHGINDYDLAYFDSSDLSWEAEDAVIRRAEPEFAGLPVPVEVCNQARVHLWFNEKFGTERAPLKNTEDALRHFASLTHAVALRLDETGEEDLLAPCGLDAVFSRTVKPMPGVANPEGWNRKCDSQKQVWPELDFVYADV
ncbi:nucleotidyltransferase family protein [Maricaulis parjimensis]|uniref:nucleotidyltransferase family protein n=1 Tax=Maricaulis parjimensis TaxID=144023 RepID=UPI001939426D|nr:nucleotidyltransferase family protein [Maricaulis parjimensis]